MPTTKRIVCLANSRKLSGRCIAGKVVVDRSFKGWIRPVSSREFEEVSEYERQYRDGQDPQVMDVIDIPFIGPKPKEYQQENWLLDPEYYWSRKGKVNWDDLGKLADPISPLWIDNYSTYSGCNDKIPVDLVSGIDSSLRLLHVNSIELSTFAPGATFGNSKRRLQGRFMYSGQEYRLWVTDPRYERGYLSKQDGDYKLGECFLTVSLGEPYEGAVYKLIAAILERRLVP